MDDDDDDVDDDDDYRQYIQLFSKQLAFEHVKQQFSLF